MKLIKLLSLSALFLLIVISSCKKEPKAKPVDNTPLVGVECPGIPFVYDADSNKYTTVIIGTQCWLRQNLNIGKYIPSIYSGNTHSDVYDNDTIEKYCFKNDTNYCAVFGGLYDWNEMMQYSTATSQGICPTGWHVPTDGDWKVLELTLGLSTTMVDSTGYRGFYQGQALLKNSETKFDALFAGFRFLNGSFSHENYYASFWSSSLRNDSTAWYRGVTIGNPQIQRESFGKDRAFAVRCLKN